MPITLLFCVTGILLICFSDINLSASVISLFGVHEHGCVVIISLTWVLQVSLSQATALKRMSLSVTIPTNLFESSHTGVQPIWHSHIILAQSCTDVFGFTKLT